MKKYYLIICISFFTLQMQSCSNRDGEIIEMIKAMQLRNEELKLQISTLQSSANSAMTTLNKISLNQITTDKKIELLQTELKTLINQLSGISVQMAVANANTADLKIKLDALQIKCAELVIQVEALGAPSNTNNLIYQSLKTSIIAYYPFNGNAFDVTGNGNNGTVNGAILTKDRFGIDNKAYSFDTNQFIEVLNSVDKNLMPFSVSLWATIKDGSIGGNLFNKYIPGYWNGYAISAFKRPEFEWGYYIYPYYLIGGAVPNGLIGGYGIPETKFTIRNLSTEQWFHFVLTVDNTGGKLYLNGKLIDNMDWRTPAAACNNNLTWQIGGKAARNATYDPNNQESVFFRGKIDDLGVWNKSLSETEIGYLYSNTFNY